jgi:hypothetical protein
MPECLLTPRRPAVLDEVFDGEAVLVNLETGLYYALDPLASQWWTALGHGTTLAALRAATIGDDARAEPALLRYLHRLADEALVDVAGTLPRAPAASAAEQTTAEPSLQVFRDMEDLLLLDPIHDIDLDGSGWPTASQPSV